MVDCNIQAFDTLMARAEALKIPLWSHFDLTYRCNLRCVHCYCRDLAASPWIGREELSTQEAMQAIDELADSGALYLTLSGGEIFLRDDFFDIAAYARKRHFCLTLFTNGTLLDERKASRIKELAPAAVEMSIYGTTAEIHDSVTQVPGSFDGVARAVALLKKERVRVVLKAALMRQNFHQALQCEDFVKGLGADDYRFVLELSPKNDGSRIPQGYQLEPDQLRQFLEVRKDVPDDDTFKDDPLRKSLCATGQLACYISPYGDVFPCIQLLVLMGNIRERSFAQIWNAKGPLRDQLDRLKTYGDMSACRSCTYVGYCKKCIGLAHMEKNDMSACYETLETLSRLDYQLSTTRGEHSG